MKAILILKEMPEDCGQCPFMKSVDVTATNYFYCTANPHNLISLSERIDGREEWCPLQPMPAKKDVVPVIRCKDCKYWFGGTCEQNEYSGRDEDDFCSWAKSARVEI